MKANYFRFTLLILIFSLRHSISYSGTPVEIYTLPGCERCSFATGYMKEHNIDYVEYSVADESSNSRLRYILQSTKDYSGGSITMPVIRNQGRIHFNISELENFLAEIEVTHEPIISNSRDIRINAYSNGIDLKNINAMDLNDDQIKEFLDVHNTYRAEVNSDPLTWSDELANYARAWGEHLAQSGCELEHRPSNGEWAQKYGENLYWSSGFAPTPKQAVDSWGDEKPLYDGGAMNDKNFAAGHYTQMIWSKTTQVGCAIVPCTGGAYLVVCNYNPSGNYFGESPIKNPGEVNQGIPVPVPPNDLGEAKTMKSPDTVTDQIREFLDAHNSYRSEVNSDPLIWSERLAGYAQAWAENLAQTSCNLQHRPDEGEWAQLYGENIWMGSFSPSAKIVVDAWGSEKQIYDGGVISDNNSGAWHYTQIIWHNTTQVGCGIAQCMNGNYIVVCNYDPAGNYTGQSPAK